MIRSHTSAVLGSVLSAFLLWGAGASQGMCSERRREVSTHVTGMDTLYYAPATPAHWVELPRDLSIVLHGVAHDHLHMPPEVAKIIFSLKYAKDESADIYGHPNRPDMWFRRFPAISGGKHGLAVSIRLGCDDLENQVINLRRAGVQGLPPTALPGCQWLSTFPTGRLETGLLLFLVNPEGVLEPVHDVPGIFFPQITPAMMAQLQQRGAGEPFITVSGFDNREHMEVMIEHDPERALPYDTPGYGIPYENAVYGGILVWTGSGFEIRQTDQEAP
jgi:hypothetical protein